MKNSRKHTPYWGVLIINHSRNAKLNNNLCTRASTYATLTSRCCSTATFEVADAWQPFCNCLSCIR